MGTPDVQCDQGKCSVPAEFKVLYQRFDDHEKADALQVQAVSENLRGVHTEMSTLHGRITAESEKRMQESSNRSWQLLVTVIGFVVMLLMQLILMVKGGH